MIWNTQQQDAIQKAVFRQSFCLIGAAGTGKTTTLKGAIQALLESGRVAPLKSSTKRLAEGGPGIALVSYTRRAVRNIAKQMSGEIKDHCLTIHKLLEFERTEVESVGEDGSMTIKKPFLPARNRHNPLPAELTTIIVDEASMPSTDLFAQLIDALPDPGAVQFIFLGDLNQLPPVYGQPILGVKLLELPIVELTQVYRQALESPIIALALAVKNNNFASFNKDAEVLWNASRHWNAKEVKEKIQLNAPGRGKVTIIPWKKEFDAEYSLKAVAAQIPSWITSGLYDPEEDMMLCPWAKSFGTLELNKHIGNTLALNKGLVVHEVIAGFEKHYFAVGDRLMVDKQDAVILEITKNYKYMGQHPQEASIHLDRWGKRRDGVKTVGDEGDIGDVDELLAAWDAAEVEDRTAQCSHSIKVRMLDTEEVTFLSKAQEVNSSSLGYAMTVHKAQGSECRKVFFITAGCHSSMLSRELVYTACTRAAEELIILMRPGMLGSAASKPRIKGDTLKDKLDFFRSRMEERMQQ
jgi:ATP-dependent exoDNAse (exonuclease V) alpha subunit